MNTMIVAMWSMVLASMMLMLISQLLDGGISNPTSLVKVMMCIKSFFSTKVYPFVHEHRVEMGMYIMGMTFVGVVTYGAPYVLEMFNL